jgi:hypothetical protein
VLWSYCITHYVCYELARRDPQGSTEPLGDHLLPGRAIGKALPRSVGNGGDDEERRRALKKTIEI